jgi:hypothetical protein
LPAFTATSAVCHVRFSRAISRMSLELG